MQTLSNLSSSKRSLALLSGIGLAVALSGCTALTGHRSQESWLKDGALALSRPVPAASSVAAFADPVLGFMPTRESTTGPVVRVNRSSKKIELVKGGRTLFSVRGDGIQGLKPGHYSVTLKQKSPMWHASTQYFEDRLLDVPAEGSSDRYRRGALGPMAIFLNDQTPIHSGLVWREEIGGVRVSDTEMARLFDSLEVGTPIEVR